ncbi:ComF family protein [Bacteroidota bacterium]
MKTGVIHDTVDFFYPRNCSACGCSLERNEELICLDCSNTLPRTHFHNLKENPVSKVFWGRIPLQWATAYFYFAKESRVQEALHHIKYKGQKDLAVIIGQWFGEDLKSNPVFYHSIDYIIPVPLHPKKEKQRGFNQSEYLAKGMAEKMNKSISVGNLVRNVHTSSQTRKSRFKRWENVKDIFEVKDKGYFTGKHVLLVDDVITTGSTIEACYAALSDCPGLKLSIASIAYAAC